MGDTNRVNPAIETWDGPLGLPRQEAIADSDLPPAIKAGFARDLAEAEAVAANPEPPTFNNTIEALERAGDLLGKAASIFFARAGNHTNETIQAAERELAPLFARHAGTIAQNKALFSRIQTLWRNRDALDLTTEQTEVLRRYRRTFVRQGAALEGEAQARLIAINERLAELGTAFGQNVLADEAGWALMLDGDGDLAGLPSSTVAAMAAAAAERGEEGKHAVTLSRSIIEPFLTFSTRRDLREIAFRAWTGRGETNDVTDNRPIIAETLRLRAEKAQLLGHGSFAALKLDGTMAKTPEAVNTLLETVWEKARAPAETEAADIAALMREQGTNHDLGAWDWRHYAEQIRAARYAYSDDEIKPYMALERVIEAAFYVANRLFGLTFEEVPGIATHHPDARVWRVSDADGAHRAVFIGDYFARPSKRSGAWMSALQVQSRLLGRHPIITNTMNFAKPPAGEPAFLSFDDARTLFHEFGHALHGMMSDVTYPSVSGTNVARDFVELPSQLFEHWLTVPEVLTRFALHHESGEPMPEALLDKVLAAQTFNAGFDTVEYTASALVDMAYHQGADAPADPAVFEAEKLDMLAKPAAITMRHRSPHFQHIFSGDSYAAGYYSYMWSEVLDADAFSAFEEAGDPFDPALAEKLGRHIYASGGTADPEDAYIAFRGKLPTPDAMLEKRGLTQHSDPRKRTSRRRPMQWSFSIGTVAGSQIRIHLTFFLLLAWVALVYMQEGGASAAIEGVLFISAIFACVVLHELGHALAARRYGIKTPTITLLPIGGVASLERMPEDPRKEIVVALAGPLVNVIIAFVLIVFLGAGLDLSTAAALEDPAAGFLARLAAINVILVLFNLIPAFPMDGGRVLRALLATRYSRVRATEMAARVGQAAAFVFGFLGLMSGNPLLVFVAIFVYIAAAGEAQATGMQDIARSLRVRDAMITRYEALGPGATLGEAAELLLKTTQHEFPVLDTNGTMTGVLLRRDLVAGLEQAGRDGLVDGFVNRDVPAVAETEGLETALDLIQQKGKPAVAVRGRDGMLVGYVTMENLAELMLIRTAVDHAE